MPATIEIESETNLEILMATEPRPMFDCELDIAACDIAAPSLSDRLSHLLIENVIDSEDDIFVKEGFGFARLLPTPLPAETDISLWRSTE